MHQVHSKTCRVTHWDQQIINKILFIIQSQPVLDVTIIAKNRDHDERSCHHVKEYPLYGISRYDEGNSRADSSEEDEQRIVVAVLYLAFPPHDQSGIVQSLSDRWSENTDQPHNVEDSSVGLRPHARVELRIHEKLEHTVQNECSGDRIHCIGCYLYLLVRSVNHKYNTPVISDIPGSRSRYTFSCRMRGPVFHRHRLH